MKRFLIFVLAFGLAGSAFALSPSSNPNALNYAQARLFGAQASHIYWSGQDTLAPPGRIDSTGHDSVMVTGKLQVAWIPGNAGTYPNYSISDSMTAFSPNAFWLELAMDSTTFCYEPTTAAIDTGVYGYWPSDKDSLGFYTIKVRWFDSLTDSTHFWADSSEVIAQSGFYTTSLHYGRLGAQFERYLGTRAAIRNKWATYTLPIPPCSYVEIEIVASRTMREQVICKWKLKAAHVN